MFLNELNKKESIAFVNLVEILAKIDGVFAEKEKDLLNEYIEELSLTNENLEKQNFEVVIKELEASTDRVKNIIYFELIGLALSDGSYDKEEVEFLNKLAAQFNISPKKQQQFIDYFKMVKDSYDSLFIDYENKLESLKKSAKDLL